MSMPTKQVVLYDQTSAANTALDTGTLNTADYDALLIEEVPSGVAGASSFSYYDPDFSATAVVWTTSTNADSSPNHAGWGTGVGSGVSSRYRGGLAAPLPAKVRVILGALGAGITGRMRIIGVRNHRGPDVASVQD